MAGHENEKFVAQEDAITVGHREAKTGGREIRSPLKHFDRGARHARSAHI